MIVSGEGNSYKVPMSLRKFTSEVNYQQAKMTGQTVPLGEELALWEGKFWKMIANRFPADVAFKPSRARMLIPKRKFSDWWKMMPWELVELLIILYRRRYDGSQITMNLGTTRSVPGHFHLHFNEFYDDRLEMKL